MQAVQELFRQDAYQRECSARVLALDGNAVLLDRTVFYPLGGGQAGDSGQLLRADGSAIAVLDTRKHKYAQGELSNTVGGQQMVDQHLGGQFSGQIAHLVAPEDIARLTVGETLRASLDWPRRLRLMRFHTTTHLLCHLVPHPVDGCSITPDYARLDFHTVEPLDKDTLTQGLAQLVAAAHPVQVGAIADAELDANPALVKSMSVAPPRGSGQVRTVRIGVQTLIDYQPCGGTHVANTSEIGAVMVNKVEKKSARTRRVLLSFV